MGMYILRRGDEYVGKRVMVMEVPVKQKRGRPKRRWLDNVKNDLSERELSGERIVRGGSSRPSSMETSHKTHRPHIKVGKDEDEEEDTTCNVVS